MSPLLQSLHPTMAAALAPFMAPAPARHDAYLPTLAELDAHRRMQIRRAELREEYDAGLDACPPARDWSAE